MKATLDVNKSSIKNGVRVRPTSCPIALAIKKLGFDSVRVLYGTITAAKDFQIYTAATTKRMRSFMHAFDGKKKDVNPAKFTVYFKPL